ncbi:Gfo/Idh/MocA family oxidoreductase [Proteiniphilum sp.]|uniref:Gfo/Idh/MocA family protein n=1 Tax=Proteiniphilum sp. TaxID=1926877 RepID=UPI002B21F389|nr:Gfo/Idh/MocA family oxidoreductase [Proteiniphilum sp.]MEA4918566.1 Gfo/Idh/MocA family oxidoreductase [Proteiniphilum sp.]
MNNNIRFAIIGFGRMGITHYSIINSHPNVEIESVADSSAIILTMMKKYLPVKTYKDYNELFETSKPDAVLVCTPPHLHYDVIEKAAQKRIHVFAEKPFTTKYEDASRLNNLFKDSDLINQVGYVNRFNDVFVKTKEFVEKGVIGKVIRFKSEMFSCTITKSDDGSGWRASRESGGGAVFEIASHAIDLVNFLIGKPDRITGSSLTHIYSKTVEDAMSTTLLYENGISGTIYINWSDPSYRKPTNKIEIFGDGGRIMADQHSLKIYMNKANKEFQLREGWNTFYITDIFNSVPFYVRGNEFTSQLYHFIECIQDKTVSNRCSFNDGANTLEVIDKIFSDYELNAKF